MIKTYIAKTCVCINVVLPGKKNLHISFVPQSNGESTFTTDCEEIINAIESHYNFGKLFRLKSTQFPEERKRIVESPITETGRQDNKLTDSKYGLKRVKVPDIASAKDYLAETFGISRTLLRSEKSILEQAGACGIEFYGIDGEE